MGSPPIKTDLATIDFEWTSNGVNEEIYGYNIFGSFYREKGFGKINYEVIQKNKYNWTIDDLFNYDDRHYFIKIEPVDESCRYIESKCEPMIFPESSAFLPFFKDTVWINYKSTSKETPNGSYSKPYKSIKDALENTSRNVNYIVMQKREDSVTAIDVPDSNNILYRNRLEFLDGKCEIFFPGGLDKNSEIKIFFLIKGQCLQIFQIDLRLVDPLGVEFKKIKKRSIAIKNFADPKVNDNQTQVKIAAAKASLTPEMATALQGQDKIILIWEKFDKKTYDSVRIFKSELRTPFDLTKIGNEIYDGKVNAAKKIKYVNERFKVK